MTVKRRTLKSSLAIILTLAMLITLLPMQVWATEVEGIEHVHEHESENVLLASQENEEVLVEELTVEESGLLEEVKADMDAILAEYGIEIGDDEDTIYKKVFVDYSANGGTQNPFELIAALEEKAMDLTEGELSTFDTYESTETYGRFCSVLETAMKPVAISTVSVLDGQISITDTANSNSVSNNVVTIKASGGWFSKGTNNITITNNTLVKSKLTFSYSVSSYNSFNIAGTSPTDKGTYTCVLEPEATLSIVLVSNSGWSNTTATLTLSEFSLVEVKESSKVKFEFDSKLGSVSVSGSTVVSGTEQVVSLENGVVIVATPNSESTFLGWINSTDNSFVSKDANYEFKPTDDIVLKAVFADKSGNANAWFGVANANEVAYRYLYDNLDSAVKSNNGNTIIVANDGILPAGDYTIPVGKALLVPFDNANTLYTDSPANDNHATYVKPSVYRTLYMANGANLIVNGSISLSAKHHAGSAGENCGSPTGAVSLIEMLTGSSITVNSGGKLYAWGFIIGDGHIIAERGANIHENFQFNDFRGGTHTSQATNAANLNSVFPINQYFIQNIEVPLTLKAGAKESCYTTVYMGSFGGSQPTGLTFISDDNAMFNLESGSVTKYYDGAQDRLVVSLDGKMAVSPLSMKVSSYPINSAEFVLPITNNLTVTFKSGSNATVEQDLAMLPGAVIIIENGAECSLDQGKSIYVYDSEEWKMQYLYPSTGLTRPLEYAPGRVGSRPTNSIESATVRVDGVFDATKGYLYSTEHGANIFSSGTGVVKIGQIGSETVTYQVTRLAEREGLFGATDPEFDEIPITPVKLKNLVDIYPYTETGNGIGTYTYINGIWHLDTDHTWDEGIVTTTPSCTDDGERMHTCTVTGCGITKAVVEQATGHSHEGIVTEPTCTAGGFTTFICSVCGDTYISSTVSANGHTWDNGIITTSSTCITDGVTTYTCSVCGATTEVAIKALGHHTTNHEAQEQTCLVIGWDAYETCSRCDYTTYVEKPALGHDITNHEAQEQTCLGIGWDAYETCSRCSHTTYVEKPALRHNITTYEAQAATCEGIGWDAYEACSRCNYTTYVEKSSLGHNYEAVITSPTCIADGYTTHTCSRCDNSYVDSQTPAKGHTLGVDADCSHAQTCTVCDTVLEAALGHEYNSVVTNPTCVSDGYTTNTCWRCGHTYTSDIITASGHTITTHAAVEQTCLAIGWDEYETCGVCDYTTYEEKSAFGHNLTDHDAQTPTCGGIGWDAYETCSRCNYTTYEEKPALGHELTNHAAQTVTCEEIGWDAYEDCARCDYTTYVEIPALGHTEVTSAAIAPTCTVAGITEGTICSVCNEVIVATIILTALGHAIVTDAAIEATCTQAGITEGSHCSVCGEILVSQGTVDKIPHSIVTVAAIEETCLTVGWDDYEYCEHCDYTTYVEIPQLGHWIVQYPAMQPTYIEPGNLPYESCRRCDYSTYEKIDALGYPTVDSLEEFVYNLTLLEELAEAYVEIYPEKDPYALIIKYIRTGVDRYNSGSWGIMGGYEDAGFAQFVEEKEAEINVQIFEETGSTEEYVKVTGLKNIENFYLSNGEYVDFGHMFGTMDITYHNLGSENHADVGGWAGDLVDLMTSADRAYCKTTDSLVHLDVPSDFETMVSQIRNQIFLHSTCNDDKFNMTDYIGDLDAYYIMQNLDGSALISEIVSDYFTEELTNLYRTEFFLKNRLGNPGTRTQVRDVVYSEYMSNKTLTTLENTREFGNTDKTYIANLRKACCYAFADYICYLAGDYVEVTNNPYYTEFYSEISTLAPGITQEIKKATTADNKQIVYYLATGDLSNPYVTVNANYGYHDTSHWEMVEVLNQAKAAQEVHGNPESDEHIRNFQIVASINADGFNMSTGEPGGLLIMDGEEVHPANSSGFFGITNDGKAIIGTTVEYNSIYRGQLRDAVGAFGTMLVKNGELAITATSNYYSDRASRTAVGITRTGKVVFMVLDGRQEPWSCGGSMVEIAQIMLEAGCVSAVNLDGGGSTTFVSKPEGSDELQITNRPSDGYARSVSSTLFMVSTAPSSTAFDHAVIESDYDYATLNTEVQLTAKGVSETGNVAELPENWYFKSSDENWATVSKDGVFEGKINDSGEVYIMVDGQVLGTKVMNVVVPDQVYFTKVNMDVVYGSTYTLPVAARYDGKEVAINSNDVVLSSEPTGIGTFNKNKLTVVAESSIRTAKVIGKLALDNSISGSMTVNLFKQGENTFDFDRATAGDRLLAWTRTVVNSTTEDDSTYTIVDRTQGGESMVTEYIFAMDMSQIPIPKKLVDLVYMLPGASADNASAWNFMLQLAERISVLTTVTCTLEFDDRFVVDYTNLKVYNEYFKLAPEDISFNEETNVLTLNLRWVDQTAAIPAETANPLCMVTGIKLTPKSDAFVNNKVTPVHVGEIGYKMYMRANALYSFACKPENQAQYGIKPFTSTYNDNGVEKPESGGYLESIYKTMEDQYTLSTAELNGWIHEGTGYAYYDSGTKYYGIKLVEGFYYDFGEDGINVGQTKFTGLFDDNGTCRCVRLGTIVTDEWYMVDEVMYHCNIDGVAHDTTASGNVTCVQGGRIYYTCPTCEITERVGSYVMPKGHTWDENHICTVCGHVGIDINDGTIRFGTVDDPMPEGTVPKYYFSPKGSYPYAFVTFDGETELTWSADATLNDDGTMRDLFMGWTNLKGIGKAYVHFEGKGDYYGTYTMEYVIVPRSVTNLSVSEVITVDPTTGGAISESNATAVLTWNKADGADYYRVYFNKNGTREFIGRTTDTTYTLTGLDLTGDNVYCIEVAGSAISTDGENEIYNSPYWSNKVYIPEGRTPSNPPSGGGDPGWTGGGTGGSGGVAVVPPDVEGTEGEDGPVPGDGTCEGGKTCIAFPFYDVNTAQWYHHSVDYVIAKGIMNGVGEGKFEPNAPTTRAMIWTMLARMAGVDTTPAEGEEWYAVALRWAMENGISDGTNPNGKITREQLATMLWRYAGEDESDHSLEGYVDDHHISDWAETGLKWANEHGIVTGVSEDTIAPQDDATRAQVAAMIERFIKNL